MPSNPLVRQPPTELVLGVVVDSVWPPRASKECYIKGQLAKHIVETQLKPHDVMEPSKCYEVSMAAAGDGLGLQGASVPHLTASLYCSLLRMRCIHC